MIAQKMKELNQFIRENIKEIPLKQIMHKKSITK